MRRPGGHRRAVSAAFTIDGNRLSLLVAGPDRLATLLSTIAGARRSLRMLYYIYGDDEAGRQVNAALIAAAGRGVRVALIVDGFGSDAASDAGLFAPLRAAGCDVCRFTPRLADPAVERVVIAR